MKIFRAGLMLGMIAMLVGGASASHAQGRDKSRSQRLLVDQSKESSGKPSGPSNSGYENNRDTPTIIQRAEPIELLPSDPDHINAFSFQTPPKKQAPQQSKDVFWKLDNQGKNSMHKVRFQFYKFKLGDDLEKCPLGVFLRADKLFEPIPIQNSHSTDVFKVVIGPPKSKQTIPPGVYLLLGIYKDDLQNPDNLKDKKGAGAYIFQIK